MTIQVQRAVQKAFGATILLFLLLAGSATALRAQAHEHGAMRTSDSTDVLEVVERFGSALAAGDSATVAALLLPDAAILEGGSMEDRQHYLVRHYPSDTRFLQAMTREPKGREVHIVGDVAYVASTSRLQGTYRNRNLDLRSAELMVLRNTPNGWCVAAIHWSSRSNE